MDQAKDMLSETGFIATLNITAPIFLLMALGFFAVKSNYFPAQGIKGISQFVARVAIPVLIFRALAERDLGEILNTPYLIAYSLGSLIPFFLCFAFARRCRQQGLSSAALYGMGSCCSNSIMVGFPIITALYGEAALIPLALTLLVENLLIMPLTLGIADGSRLQHLSLGRRVLGILPTIAKNPIIVAILLGLAVSLMDLSLPSVGSSIMDLVASSATGTALFASGGMLVGMRVGGLLPDLSAIALSKLLIHPLAMLSAFLLIPGVDAQLAQSAVILASAPMFGIFAVIGQQYGHGDFCAAAILPSTVLSFLSISVIIWALLLFQPFG